MDRQHSYRVRFSDGFEAALHHDQLVLLAEYVGKEEVGRMRAESDSIRPSSFCPHPLFDRVIFRCVIGSRAYGLDDENSDIDRRGIYLPPANLHWSLHGVPEQLENDATQEVYWELQKFVVLALKANPNVLECLYSPIVETATPLAQELLDMKETFLSKLVFQTYSGYVASQFKKMQTDIRNQGQVHRALDGQDFSRLAARRIVADDTKQPGPGAERRQVARHVSRTAHRHGLTANPQDRDRRLGRNAFDLAIDEAIEHHVPDTHDMRGAQPVQPVNQSRFVVHRIPLSRCGHVPSSAREYAPGQASDYAFL